MLPQQARSLARLARAGLRRARGLLGRRPAILMYHRVAEESFDPWGLAVSPARFAAQIEWLARNRTIYPLVEFAERHRRRALPKDAVAVTFDDGYACAAAEAAPVLERLGVPATIFIPPELIERGREYWWDELQRIILDFPGDVVRIDGAEIALGERRDGDRHWPPGAPPATPRQHAFHQLWSRLRTSEPADLEQAMERLRADSGRPADPRPSHRPLTPGEVRLTRSDVIAFGSHALTHPSLPALDPAERERQISESVDSCEALTGSAPASFAYPYGDFDAECMRLVEEAGFVCACTTHARFLSKRTAPFALPRLQVGDWPVERLQRVLAGS